MSDYHAMLGVPLSALASIIFGMMLVSFPLGAYVVFETNVGGQITHQLPASDMSIFGVEQYDILPSYIQMGDIFVAAWAIYLALFAIAILGPDRNITTSMKDVEGGVKNRSNYMMSCIVWFSILVLVSGIIEAVQGQAGLAMSSPDMGNDLVQFHMIALAPIMEEIPFRVILVGLPVFAIYAHRISPMFLVRCLWHPGRHLHIYDKRMMFVVIVIAGVAFGIAHILTEDAWDEGKVIQAAAAGIILGYVYCRHGLICALLVHWATNYFLYAYGNFVAHLGDWGVAEAFAQPFFDTIQIILMAAGALAICAMAMDHLTARPKPR